MFDMTDAPTEDEMTQAADVLRRLPRGFLPMPLFLEFTRLVVTPTMEVLPIRRTKAGMVEVLLTQRPADDPYWPSEWHIPGTVLRSTDEEGSFKTGYERVLHDELGGGIRPVGELQFVGMNFWDVKRGRELDMLHYIEVEVIDSSKVEGTFFDVQTLPETLISHHKILVPEIVSHYLERRH